MYRSYLDYNATAPLKPEARQAVLAAMDRAGNPSSVHQDGQAARAILSRARRQAAALAGRSESEVIFTSGATEANNLAISGFAPPAEPKRILASAVEHPSVLEVSDSIEPIPVRASGDVDPEALKRRLRDQDARRTLVSVMAVNNETGVIQPIEELADIAHDAGALFHSDCVQAAPHLELAPLAAVSDIITLSAHKLGGPRGVGALIAKEHVVFTPAQRGGGQERRVRSGTEALEAVAGFGAVCAAQPTYAARGPALLAMRDRMETEVRRIAPNSLIVGADAPRAPHTANIALPGASAETQVMALDLAGVSVSAGSACSSGKIAASHVLTAMGFDAGTAGSAIRVSLGWATEEADIDRFLDAYEKMVHRLSRT